MNMLLLFSLFIFCIVCAGYIIMSIMLITVLLIMMEDREFFAMFVLISIIGLHLFVGIWFGIEVYTNGICIFQECNQ